jgi:hypothetical protein
MMAVRDISQTVDIKKRLLRPGNIIALIVAAAIVYIFLKKFQIREAFAIIGNANLPLFMAAIVIFYLSLPLRGHRWKILLQESQINLPVYDLSRYYFLAWFANCIVPARIGDIYRAYLLKKNKDISFSLSLGVIFSEKVFDLATTAILVLIGGIFYFNKIDNPQLRNILFNGLWIIAVIVILFAALSWRSGLLKKILPERFHNIYGLFRQGLFRSPQKIPFLAGESFIIWLTEAARLYLVAWALGLRMDFLLAIFISQASLILMSLPLTPAGLGLVEFLMLTLLGLAGSDSNMAGAVVIADRLISFWSLIILGGIHYLLSPRYR